MILTLIGNNYKNKIILPEVIEGSYSITDKNGNTERTLIQVNALLGKWIINSTQSTQVIDHNSIDLSTNKLQNLNLSGCTIIKKVALYEYSIHFLHIGNSNDIYILYCEPSFENEIMHFNIKGDFSIGTAGNNDIIYNQLLIDTIHTQFSLSDGKFLVQNIGTQIGSFVNDQPLTNTPIQLKNGDLIFILGLKIVFIGNSIYISGPRRMISLKYRNLIPVDHSTQHQLSVNETEDNDIELYSENDYFYRAPRVVNKIEKEIVNINTPPTKKIPDNMALVASLGASLSMSVTSVFSLISAIDDLINKTATKMQSIRGVATSGTMLLGSVLIPVLTRVLQNIQSKRQEKIRQQKYRKYINSKIIIINKIMEHQREILNSSYISPAECETIILNKDSRIWQRKIDESDFLSIRVGTGNLPLDIDIKAENEKFSLDSDSLVDIYYDITKEARILESAPIAVSLLEKNISSIISKNSEKLRLYLKSIIMQLVALHSYTDLKLVFITQQASPLKFEYVKMLPHIWNNQLDFRFYADTTNDMKQLSKYLEDIIIDRESQIEDQDNNLNTINYKNLGSYYLIITDNYKGIYNLGIIPKILKMKTNIGFSLLCITDDITQLPNECQTFISLEDDKCQIFENENSSTTQKDFTLDPLIDYDYSNISEMLFNIPIKFTSSKELSLPNHYNFLEMYNVGNIEQLNIYDRWTSNDSTVSLQAPIGVDSSGLLISLDAHEKFHGPHGLIAGTTGSGKSEFIITYILSLAINYHPDDVTFVLVDYKGGGLAGAFKKKDIQLPHLVGTITNIDSVGLQRSLDSIQSELRKRQIMFNEAKNITNESTIDIYKYQKLYHEGALDVPISHLFIICDEFAELKQQQPDFMDELMSVSRIGRSLGVHLILATQKPAGIVNDQIRSNSKFGICLKVQDKSDSNDIIKKPDAAALKKAGQFYLNVGNDEYFALGQSGWTGAPYVPSECVKKEVDNSLQFITNIGTVQKQLDIQVKKANQKGHGDQLTNIVKYLYELALRKNIKENQLWLNSIPANIYVKDLRKKYNVQPTENVIDPVIGEFDDPFNQKQGILQLNLSKDGNTIIYGCADSGKEILLNTILYDTMTTHSSTEVQFYILDFGSEALRIYKKSPHVGDILFQSDSEKLSRLLKILTLEIESRKKILADYNGDYKLYLKTTGKSMPMIIIIINDFSIFLQNYAEHEEKIISITRDCTKCGITFIITSNNVNEVRYKLSQNFNKKVALQLINQGDYILIFNRVGKKKPSHINGRGLITLDTDTVYEFQTAQICQATKINSFVNKTIKELMVSNPTKAAPIPIMPDKVLFKDVKMALKGLHAVPVGLSIKTINPYVYNFKNEVTSLICSKDIIDTIIFTKYLIKEISLLKDVNLTVLDKDNLLDIKNYDFDKNLETLTNSIESNIENSLCVILGIDKFLQSLNNDTEKFNEMLKKANDQKNCNFIIIENAIKLKNHQYDSWYKNFVNSANGIWIGNGIDSQFTLTYTSNDRRSMSINRGSCYAYAIKREKPTLIKLLGVEEKRDDDE